MYTRYFWNPERDAALRKLAEAGEELSEIIRRLVPENEAVSLQSVRRRMRALGIRHARRGIWNAARDEQLITLWQRVPKLTLAAMIAEVDFQVSIPALSARAAKLGLPRRDKPHTSNDPKCIEVRSPFATARFHAALEKPVARVKLAPLETPCPFIEADGVQCGAIVNRRPDIRGVTPSQYCPTHRPRVVPISRGSIGTLATYGKAHRFA